MVQLLLMTLWIPQVHLSILGVLLMICYVKCWREGGIGALVMLSEVVFGIPYSFTAYGRVHPVVALMLVVYLLVGISFTLLVWALYQHNSRARYFAWKDCVTNDVRQDGLESQACQHWIQWRNGKVVLSPAGMEEFDRRLAALIDVDRFPDAWYRHVPSLVLLGVCWPLTLLELGFSSDSYRMLRRFFRTDTMSTADIRIVDDPVYTGDILAPTPKVIIRRTRDNDLTYVSPIIEHGQS